MLVLEVNELSNETLEIRLQAFIEYINSIIDRTEKGGYRFQITDEMNRSVGGNFIFQRQYLVPPYCPVHTLSLKTLKNIAMYLSDAIICPNATITTLDHIRYWAWIGAIAGRALESDANSGVTNFQHTVHLGILPVRASISTNNISLKSIVMNNERLILLSALAVLEGFICRYSNHLTEDGTARTNISAKWRPTTEDGSPVIIGNGQPVHKYHDIIQIWRQYDARGQTSNILGRINDMNRYNKRRLLWKFEDSEEIIDDEMNDGTYNFLRIIGKRRDLNLHGQVSTKTLAPLVLTLCCLFVLDTINTERFEEIQTETVNMIQSRLYWGDTDLHPLWPSAFYPVG